MLMRNNPFITEFLQILENRYSIDSKSMPMSEWICQNTKIRGRPFSFKDYPFQAAIADDMHPNMDVIKCSQIGLTEVQLRKMLGFLVRNQDTTGIFSLPNEKMYKKMSQTRAKPLLDQNPVFQINTSDGGRPTKSMNLVQLGRSFLHLVNATEGEATSTPADIVFNDEVDLSDQQMLALFNSRLQNSDFKISQRFSTPTFTGFGIDLSFQASDQREYMARCESCNHWQIPVFTPKFIHIPGLPGDMEDLSHIDDQMAGILDLEGAYVRCEKCEAALDLGNVDARTWVAAYPSRTHARGWRVRPFNSPRLSVEYIVTQLLSYKRRDYVRGWYNTVLGEPYTDGSVRLTQTAIKDCMDGPGVPEVGPDRPVFVGIDMGQTCHITCGVGDSPEDMLVFLFKAVHVDDLQEEIVNLKTKYNLIGGCVDRHPYTPTAEEVWRTSDGRIWPLEYRGQKELHPIKDAEENVIYWQAERTKLLDSIANPIRRCGIKLSGYGHYESVVIEHLRDMVRDEKPEEPARWLKLAGNDHYFHSLGFLMTAVKLYRHLGLIDKADPRVSVSVLPTDPPKLPALQGFNRETQDGLFQMRAVAGRRKKTVHLR